MLIQPPAYRTPPHLKNLVVLLQDYSSEDEPYVWLQNPPSQDVFVHKDGCYSEEVLDAC